MARPILFVAALQVALAQAAAAPGDSDNPLYQELTRDGLVVQGTSVVLPAPLLHEGQSAAEQRAALRGVAGSDQAVDDLLRDSVSAPFKMKIRNVAAREGTIRVVDLWFVVYASLDDLDLDALSGQTSKGGATEVGNMRFEGRTLTDAELAARHIKPDQKYDRYVHTSALLLDRIALESTNRTVATKSGDTLIVASRTAPAFDKDAEFPNRWRTIARRDGRERPGEPRPYAGGCSYARVTTLAIKPGALLVEIHGAFDEPKAWFDGAPILRSKLSLVAQDQVRHLRREIAKRRKSAGSAADR